MKFIGVIIEESLEDKSILKNVNIVSTKTEKVTIEHNTPWIKKWTMHTIEVSENKAMEVAEKISRCLDKDHNWYADYKNDLYHFIIFKKKIFCIRRDHREDYEEAKRYGMSLGIPDYQVDFSK
jgi:hypothetical protein